MLKKLAVAAFATLMAGVGVAQAADDITGAGATFPAPVYAKWAEFYRSTSGVGLNYQAIGSGGGIKQIKAKTVDFGASDKPLKAEELDASGLYQFPTVMGGVVPIVNIPGVRAGQLRLSGPVLAAIYLGDIKKWNDPQIASINPGVKLPNLPISVVHRSDGSGTSFLFTTYLSMVSPAWAQKVGGNDAVEWPLGLGGKGNDGVAAFVKQTVGSIGYVEYAYAKGNNQAYTAMQNKAGAWLLPNSAAFSAAAGGADWAHARGNYMLLLNQPGAKSWPITGVTYILLYKTQENPAKGAAVLKFFDWAYKNGNDAATTLEYVPMTPAVKAMVRKQWATEITAGGKPVYVSRN